MKEWEIKELGKVSAINYGYTQSASSDPIGPKFLRITDIQNDAVDWEEVPYCRIGPRNLPKYRLDTGDIVFARTGATTGKSYLVQQPPESVFASYLIRLRLLDKSLLPEYVSYFFQTEGYWNCIREGSTGSAQGGFNATKLSALRIPFPPTAEQRRIVAILDSAFEGIAKAKSNAENNLRNAQAVFDSYLESVFKGSGIGWVEKAIGDCFKVRSGDFLPTKLMVTGGHYDVYGGNGVAGKHNQKNLSGPNILIGRVGAKCGNVRFVECDIWITDNAFFISEYFQKFDLPFLARLLERKQLRDTANQAAQPVISYSTIKDVPLSFPADISVQQKLSEKLHSLELETLRLKSIYQRKLAALEALKRSLLERAFSGQL